MDININQNVGPELQSNYLATIIGAAILASLTPAQFATGLIAAAQSDAGADLTAHIADATDAHAATAIGNTGLSGGYGVGATDVQTTLQQVFNVVTGLANKTVAPEGTASLTLARVHRHATDAPTVNNDASNGVANDDLWLRVSTKKLYVCIDATTGAADWVILN